MKARSVDSGRRAQQPGPPTKLSRSRSEGILLQGRPPHRLQKVCRFQVPKTNPLDMARCCSHSNTKISKCGNTSSVHCVKILPGIAERSGTLHSFDFTKYLLWTNQFQCGTTVNGQIVVCSFDLSNITVWKNYCWMFMMLIEHCDTQRAQPTLRLHSSRFVVESCDVFVGNRTLFQVFGNISTVWKPNESFWSSVDRF